MTPSDFFNHKVAQLSVINPKLLNFSTKLPQMMFVNLIDTNIKKYTYIIADGREKMNF